jgi:hypothetical protein
MKRTYMNFSDFLLTLLVHIYNIYTISLCTQDMFPIFYHAIVSAFLVLQSKKKQKDKIYHGHPINV